MVLQWILPYAELVPSSSVSKGEEVLSSTIMAGTSQKKQIDISENNLKPVFVFFQVFYFGKPVILSCCMSHSEIFSLLMFACAF